MNDSSQNLTVGCVEAVVLPFGGGVETMAKVDTGAYSGALHASDIKLLHESGTKYLEFSPLGKAELRTKTTDFIVRTVRSAHGEAVERYIIPTVLTLQGVQYELTIGLTDRTTMQFEMLLGRKFLRDNQMLVDVRRNEAFDYEKETLG